MELLRDNNAEVSDEEEAVSDRVSDPIYPMEMENEALNEVCVCNMHSINDVTSCSV